MLATGTCKLVLPVLCGVNKVWWELCGVVLLVWYGSRAVFISYIVKQSQVKIGLATGTCEHVSWYYLFNVV